MELTKIKVLDDIIYNYVAQLEHTEKYKHSTTIIKNTKHGQRGGHVSYIIINGLGRSYWCAFCGSPTKNCFYNVVCKCPYY